MRNLMMAVLGLGIASAANAQDSAEWNWNGEARSRFNWSKTEDVSSANFWEQRNKLSVNVTKGDKLSGNITLVHAGNWGLDSTDISTGATDEIVPGNGRHSVFIHEAWGWWKYSDMLSFRMGRGPWTMADGSVVAKNDYEQVPVTFDGALVTLDLPFADFHAFGVKGAEFNAGDFGGAAANAGASVFYGLSANFKNLPDVLNMANIHLIQNNVDHITTAGGAATLVTGRKTLRYGITVGGEANVAHYKLTFAGHSGDNNSVTAGEHEASGTMLDVAAGVKMEDMMGLKITGMYHMDSGDEAATAKDESYDSFHYDKHEYAGYMDLLSFGNLTYFGGRVEVMPIEDTTIGIQFLSAKRSEKTGAYTLATGGAGTAAVGAVEDALGSEIDVWISHAYSEGFMTSLRLGTFSPGDAFNTSAIDDKSIQQAVWTAKFMF